MGWDFHGCHGNSDCECKTYDDACEAHPRDDNAIVIDMNLSSSGSTTLWNSEFKAIHPSKLNGKKIIRCIVIAQDNIL
jgi:hypothetical protein